MPFADLYGNTIVVTREILGREGPEFIPEWPKPIDPSIDIGPLETETSEIPFNISVEVTDSIGVACDSTALAGLRSWMGISTNERTYSDELVVDFAKWACTNTGGFTLIVSNELAKFNWAAEHGWDAYNSSKRVKQLETDAEERAHETKRLLDEHSIPAGIVLWNRMHRKVVECVNPSVTGGFMEHSNAWSLLEASAALSDEFKKDIFSIHHKVAEDLYKRFVSGGQDPEHVDHAMACYSYEEIFLTALLARMRWANIKIGPQHERYYDEVTKKFLDGEYTGIIQNVPFGAVYLDAPSI